MLKLKSQSVTLIVAALPFAIPPPPDALPFVMVRVLMVTLAAVVTLKIPKEELALLRWTTRFVRPDPVIVRVSVIVGRAEPRLMVQIPVCVLHPEEKLLENLKLIVSAPPTLFATWIAAR